MRPDTPRRACAALLGLIALSGFQARGQELEAPDVAFIEWRCERDQVWLRETVSVWLRFGFEADFLAEQMVQPFRRQLDIPARVQLPGWEQLTCSSVLPATPVAEDALEFALAEETARARRVAEIQREGATFQVFEYEFRLRVECQGEIRLPAAQLAFATAAEFSEDVFGNRSSLERRDLVLHGVEYSLQAQPLPSEGRPAAFGGAVGEFRVSASATPTRVHLGEGLKLDLVIEGPGDLGGFPPPRLEPEGFSVRGWVESSSGRGRTITYDLVPLDERVRGVQPIEFAYFDPSPPAGYRTVATSSIAIDVLPARAEVAAPVEQAGDEEAASRAPSRWWALLLFAPLPLLLRRKRNASPQRGRSALALRARDAADRFRARRDDQRLLEDYTELLAAILDCPVPAVVGPRLARRLVAVEISPELAERLAHLHEELVSARYGGPPARAAAQVDALVEELVADPR